MKAQVAYFAKADVDDIQTSSDSSDTDSETARSLPDDKLRVSSDSPFHPDKWRNIYLAALAVKNSVKEAPTYSPTWPPSANGMT